MKVFNLTDVPTKELTQRNLVNHTIGIGPKMLQPGASEDIDDETLARVRGELQHMVSVGVLACNDLPAAYQVAKAQPPVPAARAKGAAPAPALVHLPDSPAPASTEPAPAPSVPPKGRKET